MRVYTYNRLTPEIREPLQTSVLRERLKVGLCHKKSLSEREAFKGL